MSCVVRCKTTGLPDLELAAIGAQLAMAIGGKTNAALQESWIAQRLCRYDAASPNPES